jgi:monoamine oxidase
MMKVTRLLLVICLFFCLEKISYAAENRNDFLADYKKLMLSVVAPPTLAEERLAEHMGSLRSPMVAEPLRQQETVGIVGAGMAGLYSALLIQRLNEGRSANNKIRFKIFEANDRVGGRIFTHRFSDDDNQYFEAGAMRIPATHTEVFNLVDYVNKKIEEKYRGNLEEIRKYRVDLIDYRLYQESNFIFLNNKGPFVRADVEYEKFEFIDEKGKIITSAPADLLGGAINSLREEIKGIFLITDEKVRQEHFKAFLEMYDDYSLRTYLLHEKKWSHEQINYVEVATAQTHQFDHSLVELLIEDIDFANKAWKTIDQGMARLPEACAEIIGVDNISLNTKVHKIEQNKPGKVHIYHSNSDHFEEFDQVILALPPSVVHMLDRDFWPLQQEAIRSMYFEPLYKIGLRFKTRFWEANRIPSEGGGQSITDLPSRWVVYPSNGIGSEGPGVLLCYSWKSDALKWLPLTPEEQRDGALRDLSKLYPGVDVRKQFIDAKSVSWAKEWPLGDAKFLPGQLKNYLRKANVHQGNIWFAGEHLSVYHTWIRGAIDSARQTCSSLFERHIEVLE